MYVPAKIRNDRSQRVNMERLLNKFFQRLAEKLTETEYRIS